MKRYITQFNDYVFQRAVEDESPTAFMDDLIKYTYKHGAYSPGKFLAENGRLSITVKTYLDELPCEARPFYDDFIKGQLKTPGKLWAVQNQTLLWTTAKLTNIVPVDNENEIEFALLEGIWHKADYQKTFLKPWDSCMFMDCYDFKDIHPCEPIGDNCCVCGEVHEIGCNCCDCQGLTKEMALCYSLDQIKKFDPCEPKFQAVYSCDGAEKHFTHKGQKICGDCGMIAGNLYSNTVLDTMDVTIEFSGEVTNPYIEINGNGNQIKGSFKDLTIYPDGTLTQGCMDCEIEVGDWVVPGGNEYGWTIHQGNNKVVIDTGNCCAPVCAYISVDAITM